MLTTEPTLDLPTADIPDYLPDEFQEIPDYFSDELGMQNSSFSTDADGGPRLIEQRYAEDETIARRFIYGEGVNDLMAYEFEDSRYYTIKNDIGTVVGIVDGERGSPRYREVVERYDYKAYGAVSIRGPDFSTKLGG